MNNKKIHMVAFILLIIGGLNMGLDALVNWGLGDFLPSGVMRIVYILIGLAAVYEITTHKQNCSTCEVKKSEPAPQE